MFFELFENIVRSFDAVLGWANDIWFSVGIPFASFVFVILMVTVVVNLFRPLVGPRSDNESSNYERGIADGTTYTHVGGRHYIVNHSSKKR